MRRTSLLFVLISFLFITSCNRATVGSKSTIESDGKIDGHPAWIMQGNIYEVNVRQYTPEGTFAAFSKHLERLKIMGVQTLWFMPINPVSIKDRKGKLGSYYAVADYRGINPEYGTLEDWKELVNRAHEMGFKVIIDWVPNHTGADHPWLKTHPDFYVNDPKTGQPVSPFDWTDVRKLNYKNPALRDSMIASMKYWIKESGIDGFRCDVASEVPKDFWIRAISELKQQKNIFMLAEANEGWLHEAGFDATYTWDAFNMMKQIEKGERPAFGIDSVLNKVNSSYPANALRMYFTSNHDENSWNKADYGTMPGASHAPFAVLTQTISRSVPLIYSGQEEPFLDSISFFYKDTITFEKFARADFYKTLLHLRFENPALAANASFKKLATNNDAAIYSFERENKGNKVLVVLNLSAESQKFAWKVQPSQKTWKNVFTNQTEQIQSSTGMEPWGYAVYESGK
jgi:alpha-amylase